jgi:hypothetical protein
MGSGNGRCPVCKAIVSVDPGQSVPPHQPEGSREKCSDSGQPATQR